MFVLLIKQASHESLFAVELLVTACRAIRIEVLVGELLEDADVCGVG